MKPFVVSARGAGSTQVRAANWIVALGVGLDQLSLEANMDRLACERLPNGTIIARDVLSGTGYVVVPSEEDRQGADSDEEELLVEPIDDVADELQVQLGALDGAQTTRDACTCVLQLAHELSPAESGAVLLLDRGVLRFEAAVGPEAEKLVGRGMPREKGVAGYVVEQRQTILVRQAAGDARHFGELDALTGYQTRDMVAVPITHGRRLFGVMELMNLPESMVFERYTVDQMEALGAALGARLAELSHTSGG